MHGEMFHELVLAVLLLLLVGIASLEGAWINYERYGKKDKNVLSSSHSSVVAHGRFAFANRWRGTETILPGTSQKTLRNGAARRHALRQGVSKSVQLHHPAIVS
jgi:hypothetical protein